MLYQKNITMSKAHVLKRYSFQIWILFFVLSTKAEQQDYYFRQISLEQGLSQSRVQCIYRDHQGVIWIGTKWGLNSYDQSELKSYFHDREQPNSLPDNFIRFITEDRLGDLYVSTNKGIAIYNKAENQFQPLKYNGKPFNAWSYLQIGDNFLFGGEETLYQYNLTDKNITTIFPDIDGDKLKCINRIFQWSPDMLITSSKKDGLWMYDLIKKKMYRCPFVKEREINTIFVDSQNRLWVSFYGKGIACYSKEGKRLFSLSTKNSGLNNDIIFDFLAGTADTLLADFADVLIACLESFALLIGLLWKLHHDKLAVATIFGVKLHNGMGCGGGATKEIEDKSVLVSEVKHSLYRCC